LFTASGALVQALRKQNDTFEAKMQWRTITAIQRINFMKYLINAPRGEVVVVCNSTEGEQASFAFCLRYLLDDAGYESVKNPYVCFDTWLAIVTFSTNHAPVTLQPPDPQHIPRYMEAVRRGLEHIGIKTSVAKYLGTNQYGNALVLVVNERN
jgi:hypothetical protein